MKKIGFIIIAVVLALGLLGAAFAYWSQDFNVTGKVSIGSYVVSIAQTPGATMYNDSHTVVPFTAVDGVVKDGNLAGATATIGTVTPSGTSAGFSVTIANGYPGLILDIPYTITSTGTVPAKISDIKITTGGIGGASSDEWNGVAANIQYGTATDVTVENSGIKIGDSLSVPGSGTLVVTIPDALTGLTDAGGLNTPASSTPTFNFEIDTVQAP